MADNEVYKGYTDLLDSVILDNPAKGTQYRFTISSFRDVMYVGIREWYLDFEGDFAPSNNGITLPYTIHTTAMLYRAFHGLLSDAEVLTEVLQEIEDGNREDPTEVE